MKQLLCRVNTLAAVMLLTGACLCSGTGISLLPVTGTPAPTRVPTAAPSEESVSEPTVGDFTFVRLHKLDGSNLSGLIAAEAKKATQAGRKPFLEFDATWCPPCIAIQTTLDEGDPLMLDAFDGTYIIRVDIDEWEKDIPGAGYETPAIPLYFELDENGKSTGRQIDGGAWGDNIPENMAPPLKAFFSGS